MLRLAIAAALIVSLCLSCLEDLEVVRVGTEGAYPPYNFINEDGEIDGFDRELGDELCKRASLECTWVLNEWETIINNLVADEYDAIIAGMYITAEREEVIDFTQAYVPATPSVYVALAGSGEDAANGRVAVQVETAHFDYLTGAGIPFAEYQTTDELIEAVLSGEADVALVSREFAVGSIAAEKRQAGGRRRRSACWLRRGNRRPGGRRGTKEEAGQRDHVDEGRRLVGRPYQGVVRRGPLELGYLHPSP